MIPYNMALEKFSAPALDERRIFGCAAYDHKPKKIREFKLATCLAAGILLRHEQGVYRVLNTNSNYLAVPKHVVVDERIVLSKREGKDEVEISDYLIDLNVPDVS